MPHKKFEIIPTTADVGFVAYGRDLKELFINASYALFYLMAETGNISAAEVQTIEITATGLEELAINWLSEILFRHEVHNLLFKEVTVTTVSETLVLGKIWGEEIDLLHHQLKYQIKGITYHQLKIGEVSAHNWQLRVIVDV